jgi:hypothetical protein
LQSVLLYFQSNLLHFLSGLLYCQSELFTLEMTSDYYDLVFMGRFKKYCTCNLCLIIATSKRHLRSLCRPFEMFMRDKARSHLQSIFFRRSYYFYMLIRMLPSELKCNIYKNLVSGQTAQKKNLMNELKLYHRIDNFSIQIHLLIINMLKRLYHDLWHLIDSNIDYLVDAYNLMEDCSCCHCRKHVLFIFQPFHF